jgi:N-acyl-D-aspartate/D-glutamate deacylase
MAAFDTVIRHGTIATASETYQADVGIRDERIVAIGEKLADADEVVDATDMLVLPEGIDRKARRQQRLRPLPRPSTSVRAFVDAVASIGDLCGFVPSIKFEDAVSRNTR